MTLKKVSIPYNPYRSGHPFFRTIAVLNPSFGFIKPAGGGENVFFLVNDLAKGLKLVGTEVSYMTKENYDHKKGRKSLRAMAVTGA